MRTFFKRLLGWILLLLPSVVLVYTLRPTHGWMVSMLAALGVYFILGVCLLVATTLKNIKSQH